MSRRDPKAGILVTLWLVMNRIDSCTFPMKILVISYDAEIVTTLHQVR